LFGHIARNLLTRTIYVRLTSDRKPNARSEPRYRFDNAETTFIQVRLKNQNKKINN